MLNLFLLKVEHIKEGTSNEVAMSRPLVGQASSTDPLGLLEQITTIVSENTTLKSQAEEKEKRIQDLTSSFSEVLLKNQKLVNSLHFDENF